MAAPLFGDIDPTDVGPENINEPFEEVKQGPFSIDVTADFIGRTKLRDTSGFHNLKLGSGQIEFAMVYYYEPCIQEGANVSVIYQNTDLQWRSNPYFSQSNYTTAAVTLGFFSKRLPEWTWNTKLWVYFDNLEYWNASDYMYYDLLLWGRYDYCDNIGVHIGFFAETGMKMDRLYPVIGIDYTYSERWKISFVFPLNMSLVYTINRTWDIALAARIFDERNRAKPHDYWSKALWRYTATGIELGVDFHPTASVSANLHVGSTVSGRLKVSDHKYQHRQRISLDPAPYAGGEVQVSF
jgi:hypothetical protein